MLDIVNCLAYNRYVTLLGQASQHVSSNPGEWDVLIRAYIVGLGVF